MEHHWYLFIYQFHFSFLANYKLTTVVLAEDQLTVNPVGTLYPGYQRFFSRVRRTASQHVLGRGPKTRGGKPRGKAFRAGDIDSTETGIRAFKVLWHPEYIYLYLYPYLSFCGQVDIRCICLCK